MSLLKELARDDSLSMTLSSCPGELAVADTILIVDDEDSVRQTFQEWLANADLGCDIQTAADAEGALRIANRQLIDLAVLDWNLGAGNDGLRLLEDLCVFNPDIVAIMVTGYAHQATPLDAMRMGVRDYFDKNQDLSREPFLKSVRKQLDQLRPAKRQRQLQRSLGQFRDSVDKILPLVRNAAAINDPVPLTESVRGLLGFMLSITKASNGVLVVRTYEARRTPAEIVRAYDTNGGLLSAELSPYAQSLASAVVSMQEPCVLSGIDQATRSMGVQLQPFEKGKHSLLAVPINVGPGIQAVLELFDKPGEFVETDKQLVKTAAEFGSQLLKHALAEREYSRLLYDAVEAASQASLQVADTLYGSQAEEEHPPDVVMEKLREDLKSSALQVVEGEDALQLAELLRNLTTRYGPGVAKYCLQMLEGVDKLMKSATNGE